MDLLTFHVGNREFAVELRRVQELVNPPPITRVPHSPPALLGLAGLRGAPTAVVDAGLRLVGERITITSRTPILVLDVQHQDGAIRVGLLVEAAGRTLELPSLLTWTDGLARIVGADACTGFADVDGSMVTVLDVDRLLRFDRGGEANQSPGGPAVRAEIGSPAPATAPAVPSQDGFADRHLAVASRASAAASSARPTARRRPPPAARRGLPFHGSSGTTLGATTSASTPQHASRMAPGSIAQGATGVAPRIAATAHAAHTYLGDPLPEAARAPHPAPDRSRPFPFAWLAAAGLAAIVFALLLFGLQRGDERRKTLEPVAFPSSRDATGSYADPRTTEPAPAHPTAPNEPIEPSAPPEATLAPPPTARSAPPRSAPALPAALVVTPTTPACEIHEVVKGDTLWRIAELKLGDPSRWPKLFGENRDVIVNPDLIQVHDRIRVPGACVPPERKVP